MGISLYKCCQQHDDIVYPCAALVRHEGTILKVWLGSSRPGRINGIPPEVLDSEVLAIYDDCEDEFWYWLDYNTIGDYLDGEK